MSVFFFVLFRLQLLCIFRAQITVNNSFKLRLPLGLWDCKDFRILSSYLLLMKVKGDDNENRNSFDLLLKNPDGSFLSFGSAGEKTSSPAEPKPTHNCLLVSFCFSVRKE